MLFALDHHQLIAHTEIGKPGVHVANVVTSASDFALLSSRKNMAAKRAMHSQLKRQTSAIPRAKIVVIALGKHGKRGETAPHDVELVSVCDSDCLHL